MKFLKKSRIFHWITIGRDFRIIPLLLTIILTGTAAKAIERKAVKGSQLQEQIAREIIRFHVIANSDSESDQELKFQVKDALLAQLTPLLANAENIDESRQIILKNLNLIQETANEIVTQSGYDYPVAVSLEDCYFPMRTYGDFVFPPGTYEALRVQIGSSKGKNWWCVMFPPLCLVDETYSVVGEDAKKDLKHLLTEEEFNAISRKPIRIRFKLLDIIRKLFYDE